MLSGARLLAREKIFDNKTLPYITQLIPLSAICAVLAPIGDDRIKRQLCRWYWCGVFGELSERNEIGLRTTSRMSCRGSMGATNREPSAIDCSDPIMSSSTRSVGLRDCALTMKAGSDTSCGDRSS